MSKSKTIILTVVITAVATSALWVVGLIAAFAIFGDSAPFSITVDVPEVVKVGDEFAMRVITKNVSDEPSVLGSIDLYDSFADGFEVVRVAPFPKEVTSAFGMRSYYFSERLSPGNEVTVTFTLRASKVGSWTGQIDSCTPSESFASTNVSISVEK